MAIGLWLNMTQLVLEVVFIKEIYFTEVIEYCRKEKKNNKYIYIKPLLSNSWNNSRRTPTSARLTKNLRTLNIIQIGDTEVNGYVCGSTSFFQKDLAKPWILPKDWRISHSGQLFSSTHSRCFFFLRKHCADLPLFPWLQYWKAYETQTACQSELSVKLYTRSRSLKVPAVLKQRLLVSLLISLFYSLYRCQLSFSNVFKLGLFLVGEN